MTDLGQSSFIDGVFERVRNNLYNCFDDNFDYLGMLREDDPVNVLGMNDVRDVFTRLKNIMLDIEKYENVYLVLSDKLSQDLLIKLVVFRVLGHRRYKLPLSTPEYFSFPCEVEDVCLVSDKEFKTVNLRKKDVKLHKLDFSKIGHDIILYHRGTGARNMFVDKQYEYSISGVSIRPESGNYVIDAGACWGERAIYFSSLIGKKGKVFSFEITQEAREIFAENLRLNPRYAKNISLFDRALWNETGKKLSFQSVGPGTSLLNHVRKEATEEVMTETIDNFITSGCVEKVDYIKMDIEGAELKALKGAEETIRQFRPKLAISVYHNRGRDMIDVPLWINKLGLGYKFYLGHYTIHNEETVLYAIAE